MKGSFARRAALLAAVGAAALGGSTAAWLGTATASGSQPAATGGSLTFKIPTLTLNCGTAVQPVRIELFASGPDGTFQHEAPIHQTCSGSIQLNGFPGITFSGPATGSYEVGVQFAGTTSEPVAIQDGFTAVVTNGSGEQMIASPSPTGSGSGSGSASNVQLVSTFVYNPKLFKLGQS
jgi:hypothetical protein